MAGMARLHPSDLGTVLGVWGHPDDEAYLASGLMALAVREGRRVACLTATRGEAGFPDLERLSEAERRNIREAEIQASLAVLGVQEHHWLDHPDGGCHEVPVEVGASQVAGVIEAVQPDTVLTFGPDGGTFHTDHMAVSRWTTAAVRQMGSSSPRLLYSCLTDEAADLLLEAFDPDQVMMVEGAVPPTYPVDGLAVCFDLDDDLLDLKVAALRSQTSQVEAVADAMGAELFRAVNAQELYREPTAADWPD
jgi:LmbE family N-acetylglucosaminyl deacetylase